MNEKELVVLTPDLWEAAQRALNFYGNEANWEQSVVLADSGERARNVLGMIRQEETNGGNGEG